MESLKRFGIIKKMSSGTLFEPQEIILTEISFPNRQFKKRPVLVISKFSKNTSEDTFVCLPITSSLYDDPLGIKINNSDIQEGFFPKPSQVLCQYYFTELKGDIDRKIGKITPQFYQKVKIKIRTEILDV